MAKSGSFNPFLLTGYHSPPYFCDRVEESRILISNAVNGGNTTLISLRRMGKTGLLHHCLLQLQQKKKGTGIYLDIFDTENFAGFINKLATAVMRSVPEKHPLWKKIWSFIRQLRPVISYDELSGQPEVTLDFIQPAKYESSLQSILSFLESQGRLFVIAIDEFQQITRYPEKNTEAVLRTHLQQLKNVRFIFSGSSPHLLTEMFHSSKRPFFSSTQTLSIKEIEASAYEKFIGGHFRAGRRKISRDGLGEILRFSKGHTYYTQALCNKLYTDGTSKIEKEDVQAAASRLLKEILCV